MTVELILIGAGCLMIGIGILGGGIEIKDLKVPSIPISTRVLSILSGAVMLGLGAYFNSIPVSAAPDKTVNKLRNTAPGTQNLEAPGGILVVEGSYGLNVGAPVGNATKYLEEKCNGLLLCEYVINYEVIGDPAPTRQKDYKAVWRCGIEKTLHERRVPPEAGYKTPLQLTC